MKREKAQREMEERMERQRREETRIAREEAELIARERAREDRLKEREERAAAREGAAAARLVADQDAKDQAVKDRESRKRRRDLGLEDWDDSSREGSRALTPARGKTPNGVSAKNGDDRWELNCEVCRKHGWNIVSFYIHLSSWRDSCLLRMGTRISCAVTIADGGSMYNATTGSMRQKADRSGTGTRWTSR